MRRGEFVERGVAKELARCVLPMGTFTQFFWTVNARSLMNFLSLRNAPTAQYEIRRYAEALETFFAELMPVTYEAFVASHPRRPRPDAISWEAGGSEIPSRAHWLVIERLAAERPCSRDARPAAPPACLP